MKKSDGRWDDEYGRYPNERVGDKMGGKRTVRKAEEGAKDTRLVGQAGVIGQHLLAHVPGCPYSLIEDAYELAITSFAANNALYENSRSHLDEEAYTKHI
jgi:hypothetical protein